MISSRVFLLFVGLCCSSIFSNVQAQLKTGADMLASELNQLKGKRIALVVNQTAMVGSSHLADWLIEHDIHPVKIFAPEHGFRGEQDAGEHVENGMDKKTGIPVISLYGSNKKPAPEALQDVDLVIYDIQDVGARFYTFLSTLYYMMDACYLNQIPLWVLDRPNPNGNRIDGPVLNPKFQSFVGVVPIPVLHGLSSGEFARMVNGERWLESKGQCNLKVIACKNWKHSDAYALPVRPSPNLPNSQAICLYPSLCFFEGTRISIGRGTSYPFQVYGHPQFDEKKGAKFHFTPKKMQGAKQPLLENETCYGFDLRKAKCALPLDLSYLFQAYRLTPDPENFFLSNGFFDKLAGTDELRLQLTEGASETLIRESWKAGLENYIRLRKKYLLYPQ